MCWNIEVTIFFVVMECATLAYMFHRNKDNDRWNILVHLPVMTQEVVQIFLWKEIGEDQDTCSHRNRQLGLLIGAIIYGLPIHLAVVGRATATKHTPSFRMEFIKRFLAVLVWYWIGNMTYLYKGFTEGWYPSCTFAGPWSHQIWPIVRIPNMLFRAINGFLYIWFSGMAIQCFQRPTWAVNFYGAIGGPTVLVLVFVLGEEWGSFWCFSATLLCFVYLMEPYMFRTRGYDCYTQMTAKDHMVMAERRAKAQSQGEYSDDLEPAGVASSLIDDISDKRDPHV